MRRISIAVLLIVMSLASLALIATARTTPRVPREIPVYYVSVDYDRPLEAMVKAGNYEWVSAGITRENFPNKKHGVRECQIVLVKYEKAMDTDEVVTDLEARGLRPAVLEELLAFDSVYPYVQRELVVIALGSVWMCREEGCSRHIPYVTGDGSRRSLRLGGWAGKSPAGDRFAAVRK